MNKTAPGICICALLFVSGPLAAMTLTYTNVDPAGIGDTVLNGVAARLIRVIDDELVLEAGNNLTIQVSFVSGQSLRISPAANPPGTEQTNLALVSPSVNGSPPGASLAGTVSVTSTGDFKPGSGIAGAFVDGFVPNSPLAGSDTILLINAGNLTDTGFDFSGLEYQITVPEGFSAYPLTGMNLLVTGGSFAVVPLPATLP